MEMEINFRQWGLISGKRPLDKIDDVPKAIGRLLRKAPTWKWKWMAREAGVSVPPTSGVVRQGRILFTVIGLF